jgi:metal-dependent HD superfamily phosphatase/phosphodiesterase
MLTYDDIRNNAEIKTYITKADESLAALGYTEHSFAHVGLVAENCGYILQTLGFAPRARWSSRRSRAISTTSGISSTASTIPSPAR